MIVVSNVSVSTTLHWQQLSVSVLLIGGAGGHSWCSKQEGARSKKRDLASVDINTKHLNLLKHTHTHTHTPEWAVKNCEGSEILSYLQANKLACHSFIRGGRLAGQRDSRVRDKGLYYSWFSRQLELHVLIGNPLLSSLQEWWRGGPFWTLHT